MSEQEIVNALRYLLSDFRTFYPHADKLQSVKDAKEILTALGISFVPRGGEAPSA